MMKSTGLIIEDIRNITARKEKWREIVNYVTRSRESLDATQK